MCRLGTRYCEHPACTCHKECEHGEFTEEQIRDFYRKVSETAPQGTKFPPTPIPVQEEKPIEELAINEFRVEEDGAIKRDLIIGAKLNELVKAVNSLTK